jgi:hypothetical protein
MSTTVARFPFVSKADILRAYRPGEDASDRTFRTLREHGLVSSGLAIRHRRKGRVAGQLRCYSALNIDAVILARHDQRGDALEAAVEAQRFEAEWEPTVKALAVELDLADFDAFRTARNLLAHELAPACVEMERLHARLLNAIGGSVREEFVRIGAMSQDWATLEILAPQILPAASLSRHFLNAIAMPIRQHSQQLAVDSFLPLAAALDVGDLAILRIEHSAGSSLLSLLAAIGEAEEDITLDSEIAAYFSEEPLSDAATEHVERRRAAGDTITVPSLTVPLAS